MVRIHTGTPPNAVFARIWTFSELEENALARIAMRRGNDSSNKRDENMEPTQASSSRNESEWPLPTLLESHYHWLKQVVYVQLQADPQRRQEVEDVAHDVSVRVLSSSSIPSFRNGRQFRAWMARVVVNHLHVARRDRFRKKRDPRLEVPLDHDLGRSIEPSSCEYSSPLENAALLDEASSVLRKLGELNPPDRKILRLRACDEDCFKIIAAKVGLTEDAVRMRYRRAVARLSDRASRVSLAS